MRDAKEISTVHALKKPGYSEKPDYADNRRMSLQIYMQQANNQIFPLPPTHGSLIYFKGPFLNWFLCLSGVILHKHTIFYKS